ncbi:hypothetical protein HRbin27_01490 [bacterium HR27]|nr:hypothetical protein HRbin27_01490 [bacterium HR27]
MSDMSEKERMLEERRRRALEGLQSGRYTVRRVKKGPVWTWDVLNGTSGYVVTYDVARKEWHCPCPDFQRHRMRCKHTYMVEILEKGGVAPAPEPQPQASAPAEAAQEAASEQAAEEARARDQAPQGADPVDPVMPFGRHKGRRLSEILEAAPDDLLWIVRKMEPRSEAEQALKEAAAALVEKAARERAEAILNGKGEMPVLPFGEEKGKPLDRAHPKWAAVLAKKGVQDAFTFADAVLYEVARLLQARRKKAGQKAGRDELLTAVREAVREELAPVMAELARIRSRLDANAAKNGAGGMDEVALRFALEELALLEEEKRENELAKEERLRRLTRPVRSRR